MSDDVRALMLQALDDLMRAPLVRGHHVLPLTAQLLRRDVDGDMIALHPRASIRVSVACNADHTACYSLARPGHSRTPWVRLGSDSALAAFVDAYGLVWETRAADGSGVLQCPDSPAVFRPLRRQASDNS